MTTEPAESQVISDMLTDVFCECRSTMQADVGKLSGDLFLKVDVEGQTLRSAAEAVGLGTREARTLLFMFRMRVASALVGSISAAHPVRGPGPN